MSERVIASTCWECSTKCGSLITVHDGRVVKITGNPAHPHSAGAFCVKGMNAPLAALDHPDRPLHPLRRGGERGAGRWERVAWDEALAEIADRLGEVKRRYGPLAICGAVSNAYFSRGAIVALLLRSLGSPNHMINQDLCQGCRNTAAMLTGLAAAPLNEVKRTRSILVVGKSPSESDVVQWMHLKAAKRRGATVIAVANSPHARQRRARPTVSRAAGPRHGRPDSRSRWPASSLRPAGGLSQPHPSATPRTVVPSGRSPPHPMLHVFS
ncbi:MAG: molybdopterin-dependent oxidoreductase [candidate division NC10 bacterium]|nr:molybdopterin-dependent oxidoreductase [Candidatus Rokubacteria bacterium]MBI2560843.1 molybdopterin-dependent oxidoreductase [candidate division NC10 bacterium]